MLLFLTPETLASPSNLTINTVPRRFLTLGRRLYPRAMFGKLFWRTVIEAPVARYCIALSIFPIALIFKPEWALPISLAPVPMAMFVMVFESYVLSVPSPTARRALMDPVDADRGTDLLKVRANDVLTKLAAERGADSGTLNLVIEQSDLLKIPPLTYVSVQQEGGKPSFMDLGAAEREMIAEILFDADLTEDKLRMINVFQDTQVRVYTIDPKQISAHARLAAMANSPG
ncbi:MAG: hypothetical protein AAF409_18595 [Pseudomonadota bacterium]